MNGSYIQRPSKPVFMEEAAIVQALRDMERDAGLLTAPVPIIALSTPSTVVVVSFREKHLTYLKGHPKVNPEIYLANLRTMIKIRP